MYNYDRQRDLPLGLTAAIVPSLAMMPVNIKTPKNGPKLAQKYLISRENCEESAPIRLRRG